MQLILIMLPLFFQIVFGRKAIGEDIKWSFGTICAISFFGQILLTILAFNLTTYYLEKNNNSCGMPLVGLAMLSIVFTFFLFITMIIQERIKKSYQNDEDLLTKDEDDDILDYQEEENNEEEEIN